MKRLFFKNRKLRMIFIIAFTGLHIVGLLIMLSCAPKFGGTLSKSRINIYNSSPNFENGKFINSESIDLSVSFSFKDLGEGIGMLISPKEGLKPKNDIPVIPMDSSDVANFKDSTRLFWFGHSTFLLQTGNKNILIDPMFEEVPSPFSWLGGSRFNPTLPISLEKLPTIDAVIISHDHYDHLDYGSILKLKDKAGIFYTPLGVGMHLEKWGVEKRKIIEMDWWDDIMHDDIVFRCVPAQHRSGRKINTANTTLWCSWIIKSETENIYFSGDGGYGEHFKKIGEKFGPFDFAMIECGQYNEKWPYTHMFPEQTAQAAVDLKAKYMMPIHWGAFNISQHTWSEPVERVTIAANKLKLPLVVPKIGEPIVIQKTINFSKKIWWKKD